MSPWNYELERGAERELEIVNCKLQAAKEKGFRQEAFFFC
jgi:hypothetical protein